MFYSSVAKGINCRGLCDALPDSCTEIKWHSSLHSLEHSNLSHLRKIALLKVMLPLDEFRWQIQMSTQRASPLTPVQNYSEWVIPVSAIPLKLMEAFVKSASQTTFPYHTILLLFLHPQSFTSRIFLNKLPCVIFCLWVCYLENPICHNR